MSGLEIIATRPIATARERDLTIITRDRAILAYGAAGHVKTLAC
ncbi:MAG TPA: hypothetical protein VL202_11575 [Pararhizobium sp.]|nr:hypothetical protein [Pararhizobium sp.]HTO31803.1 hypothetical protein [Pararhizobium sp.]